MANWADVASCYRWLHDKAEKQYSQSNMMISVPVIILSTLTGTANFAIDSFVPPGLDEYKKYVQAGIGAVSIFAGILTTLGNFFQYAQKSEGHKVAGIAWGKFQRLVAVELAINPLERLDAMDFLKICRQDLDRLIEQSPPIPDNVIALFEREFKKVPNLKMPEICHGIEHTQVFDSSKPRLTKLTAEAALQLKLKKKLLRDDILPDFKEIVGRELETAIARKIQEVLPAMLPKSPPPEEGQSGPLGPKLSELGEADWRKLLVGRRHGHATPPATQPSPSVTIPGAAEVNEIISGPDSVVVHVVGSTSEDGGEPNPVVSFS